MGASACYAALRAADRLGLGPFCALSVAVDLDDRDVDYRVFHVRIIGDSIEEALPDPGLRPVA